MTVSIEQALNLIKIFSEIKFPVDIVVLLYHQHPLSRLDRLQRIEITF